MIRSITCPNMVQHYQILEEKRDRTHMTIFRPAAEHDLAASYYVYYLNEIRGLQHPPPRASSPMLQHIFETGTVYVAEQDGQIIGYAGAIKRGPIAYLTDLFVRPGAQSAQLGKMLLQIWYNKRSIHNVVQQ